MREQENAERRKDTVHELRAREKDSEKKRHGDGPEAHKDNVADDADDLQYTHHQLIFIRAHKAVIVSEEGEERQKPQQLRRIVVEERLRLRNRHMQAPEDQEAQLINDEALNGTAEGRRHQKDAPEEMLAQHLLQHALCSCVLCIGTGHLLRCLHGLLHHRLHFQHILLKGGAGKCREQHEVYKLTEN